jgi:hypothetical protein
MDQVTNALFDGLRKNVFVAQNDDADVKGEVRLKLAALLPGMARWSHLALNGLPNELVDVRASDSFLSACSLIWKTVIAGAYKLEGIRSVIGAHVYII